LRRYQDISHDVQRHIVTLTKAGEFRGRQAARTVMIWLAMNIANTNDEANGLRKGYVMDGCIGLPAISNATGLDKATVSRAMSWLHDQGFIRVRHDYHGKRLRIASVAVTSHDAASEAERTAWLESVNLAPEQPVQKNHRGSHLRLAVSN
jgi:DNA-binding MarR family transcriptional regulator